jgi:hypothetical protein
MIEPCTKCKKTEGWKALDGLCSSCHQLKRRAPHESRDYGNKSSPKGIRGHLLKFLDARSQLFLVLIGSGLIYYGYQELQVSRGTTTEPLDVELSTIEAGSIPTNNYLRIGEHVSIYHAGFYETTSRDRDAVIPKVDAVYYPIISMSHPYLENFDETEEPSEGDPSAAAEDRPVPNPKSIAVLVRTT